MAEQEYSEDTLNDELFLSELNERRDNKHASIEFIKALGYKKSGNKVVIKAMFENECILGSTYALYELIDPEQPKREVGFSYLYDIHEDRGIVLPCPFKKYFNK